jgi:DNA-binding IclR family transcriptional regulator
MRIVGVEMLNNRGVCALHIKTIAAAAGVSVSTARGALKTAKEIGLVTVERLMGNYDVRSRTPTWLAALRDLNGRIERFAQRDPQETAGKKAAQR